MSVSFFEDEHENTGKGINACIAHTAGANPADLSLNEAIKVSKIYDFDVMSEMDDLPNLFGEAAKRINAKGGQEGAMVCSCNDSNNDGYQIVTITWSSLDESNIRENSRPSTCMDNCSIF